MIRFLDLIFSTISIILLIPLLIPTLIVLRFTGEGELFFVQKRVGKDMVKFDLYKLVTMLKNSPQIGTGTVTVKDDPRVLPFGKFLRKTKINELPQLLNIFFGDMSVIGPRPQTPSCFDAFSQDEKKIISKIKPGLSGIGPIIFRSEEKILNKQKNNLNFYNEVIGPYKGKIEAWYVENISLKNYCLLIMITIWVILKPNTTLVWRIFKGLPIPPDSLKKELNYTN